MKYSIEYTLFDYKDCTEDERFKLLLEYEEPKNYIYGEELEWMDTVV